MKRRELLGLGIVALRRQPRSGRLVALMNDFASKWNELAQDMNERQVFDVKRARDISRRFRALYHSNEWPQGWD